ncbi:MAG: RDD family protein, partial [Lysobacteraceae bacterium]
MNSTPISAVAPSKAIASACPAGLGWRLLALVYDLFPALALWFVVCYAIDWTRSVDINAPLQPHRLLGYIELALLWLIPGAYAVISWHRGGQTIGMRPWRLKLVADDGRLASWRALCLRYAVATLSLGLSLVWCLIDRDRRGLHDLVAGTRFVRLDLPGSHGSQMKSADA